jgi:hypothetical protein
MSKQINLFCMQNNNCTTSVALNLLKMANKEQTKIEELWNL